MFNKKFKKGDKYVFSGIIKEIGYINSLIKIMEIKETSILIKIDNIKGKSKILSMNPYELATHITEEVKYYD